MLSIRRSNPDVVLMDIEMPGIDGVEATSLIHTKFPSIKVLIQTIFDDDEKVFKAICAGASGYILKDSTPAKLLESIEEVHTGGAPMSPTIASKVLRLFQKIAPQTKADEDEVLTKREKEILSLIVDGYTFKQIAEKTFISYETVRSHVKNIYKKLHVASSTEAVVKALRQGII
jgi:DNA-binding NarL/FixJ family response regulator